MSPDGRRSQGGHGCGCRLALAPKNRHRPRGGGGTAGGGPMATTGLRLAGFFFPLGHPQSGSTAESGRPRPSAGLVWSTWNPTLARRKARQNHSGATDPAPEAVKRTCVRLAMLWLSWMLDESPVRVRVGLGGRWRLSWIHPSPAIRKKPGRRSMLSAR